MIARIKKLASRTCRYGFGLGALVIMLLGCGPTAQPNAGTTLSGLVAAKAPMSGTIALRDSALTVGERTASLASDGTFALDVGGVTPPFMLRADAVAADGARRLYSVAEAAGEAEVTPFTNAAFLGAADRDDGEDAFLHGDGDLHRQISGRFGGLLSQIRSALQPLFDRYGVPADLSNSAAREAMRAMLDDVEIEVSGGNLVVINRATGGVIYSGPLRDLGAGTFNPENIPANPGTPPACSFTYSAWGACQPDGTQHRTVTTSSPAGCTGTPVLSQSCTYTPPSPPPCTYAYSAWGACQPDGTQHRTVTSSSPAGCTGTPVLSQSCTYTPPSPPPCTYAYSAWGACQPDGTQSRTVTSSSPAGCMGAPVLSQSCTYTIDGLGLYTANCAACHGAAPGSKQGAAASAIQNAIDSNRGGMGSASLRALTPAQVQAIADAIRGTGTPAPSNDQFGLKMIYSSKPGASSWVMPADPINDPRPYRGGGFPNFSRNPDGSFKVTLSMVRLDVAQNNGFHEAQLVLDQSKLPARGYMQDRMDWKNVEVTAYYRINKYSSSTTNGEAHIEHVMGGARQTSEMALLNGFPKACEADSYHANLYPLTGRTKYERDLMHTDGYSMNDPESQHATTPFATSRAWVGWKTVKYVMPDGKSVKLESYIDRGGNNTWQKIFEFVDHGQWGPTRGRIGSRCGGGEYTTVTWAGPIIGLRWDNITDMDVKWASIREIVAP